MSFLVAHPVLVIVAAAVLAALTLTPVAHVAYTRWARRRYPLSGQVFVHEGVHLHYTRCGTGPVVLLVHGANGTSDDFPRELVHALSEYHMVIAIDRPGHGWSGARSGPLGMHENAQAAIALLRFLQAKDATVVGHSYGAAVALRAALEAPDLVSHVVAVTPCTAVDPRNMRYVRVPVVAEPVGLTILHYVSLLLMPVGVPVRQQAWHPAPAPAGWGMSRAFAYIPSQMHASARNFRALYEDVAWLEDHLPQIRCRLTVIAGGSDSITPPARHVDWMRRAVPNARIDVLPGVGHWLLRLRPELITEAVGRPAASQPPDASSR